MGLCLSQDKIFFVYNAKDDFLSVIGDFIYKAVSPKNYPCSLCKLSYGIVSKKKKWREFLESLDHEYIFVYKNQKHPVLSFVDSYPVVLIGEEDSARALVSTYEINQCKDIDQLILLLNQNLEANLKD